MERRLGRGLGSLLGQASVDAEGAPETEVELSRIRPNPHQPRRHFESTALEELRASIAQHGVLQPICVRPSGAGFEIISGERRFRASQLAGRTSVPVVVRDDVTDEQMLELALVENLQREDLDPIEKARGFRDLADRLSLTQEQVAERVGLKRTTVTNHLRLLDLPTKVQDAVREGLVSMGHARALLAFPSESGRLKMLGQIVRKGLSVRQVEESARQGQSRPTTASSSKGTLIPSQPSWVRGLEDRLGRALGTKVKVQNGAGYRGRVTVEYYSQDDLNRLIERLDPSQTL